MNKLPVRYGGANFRPNLPRGARLQGTWRKKNFTPVPPSRGGMQCARGNIGGAAAALGRLSCHMGGLFCLFQGSSVHDHFQHSSRSVNVNDPPRKEVPVGHWLSVACSEPITRDGAASTTHHELHKSLPADLLGG